MACQAPLSMWFPRHEYWSGLGCHFLLQGNLPEPGIKPTSPALQANSVPLSHCGSPILCNVNFKSLKLHNLYIIAHTSICILYEQGKHCRNLTPLLYFTSLPLAHWWVRRDWKVKKLWVVLSFFFHVIIFSING